jgi:hypothetical protein
MFKVICRPARGALDSIPVVLASKPEHEAVVTNALILPILVQAGVLRGPELCEKPTAANPTRLTLDVW